MKYLYYGTNLNPIITKIKKIDEELFETEDISIEEAFNLKESGKYEIIKIQTTGLYYKTSKSSKKRTPLHGEINLFEFENGGTWENVSFIEQIKFLKELN